MLTSSTILFNSHSTRGERAGEERRQGSRAGGRKTKGTSRRKRGRSRRVIWGRGFLGTGEVRDSLSSGKPEIFGVRDEQPTKWQKSGLKS